MKPSWPTKKLGELLILNDPGIWGLPINKSGEGVFILRSTNILEDGSLDFREIAERKVEDNKIKNLYLQNGDILLEKSGGGPEQPVGRVAYFMAPDNQKYIFANFIQRLRPKKDLINNRFLFFYLFFIYRNGLTQRFQSQTTGIRNLNLKLYFKIKIPLPPLKIQQKIVERLDAIKKAQELNDKQVELAEELFQSLLHRELDPKGKNWEVKKLGDVCEIARGGSPRPINKYLTKSSDGINWIKIGDVKEGEKYITSTAEKIKPEGISKTRLVQEGDLILSNSMSFGRPYILKISGAIHDGWLLLHINNVNQLLQDFLYYILCTTQIKIQFERFASGGVVKNLNSDLVRRVKIPLPPLETQRKIVKKLSAVQEYKKKLLDQKQKLHELFESVLNKSFKGQL